MAEQKEKLVMRDPKDPQRVFPDQDSIDKFLEIAKQDQKKELFFFRKRIGYDRYLIQIYANHPSNEKAKAAVLYEISGVSRKEMEKMKIFPAGKPMNPVIKDGKPVKGDSLKPIDTKPVDPKPDPRG